MGAVALLVPHSSSRGAGPLARRRLAGPETAVKRNAGQNEHQTNRTAIAYTRARLPSSTARAACSPANLPNTAPAMSPEPPA